MRSQHQVDYALAIELVGQVNTLYPATGNSDQLEVRRSYGRLCHDFPIMLLNARLAQTVAFYRSKESSSGRGLGYRLVLEHAATILGEPNGESAALENRIQNSEMRGYREDTMRLLDAWVYLKRLAVSVLKVEAGDDTEPSLQQGSADA